MTLSSGRLPGRTIAAIAVAATLFTGFFAHAQDVSDPKAEAGITPDSRWYAFDLLAEKVWGVLLDDASEADYLRERAAERLAEARVMGREKGVSAPEVERALGLMSDHLDASKNIASRLRDEERAMKTLRGLHQVRLDVFQDEFVAAQKKEMLESRRQSLREQIAEARKSRDEVKTAALIKQLAKVREEYEENDDGPLSNVITTGEILAEQIEDAFTGEDRARLVLQRAEAERERISRMKDPRGLERLDALIDRAKKAIDAADKREAEAAARALQRSVREGRTELKRQVEADEMKKDMAVEQVAAPKPTAPPPAPAPKPKQKKPAPAPAPAPKKELETIPSESVKTAPLQLLYYPNLNGQVDLRIDAQYSGQGGLPPYHFQLESGVGFPPSGVILDANGLLSGTPKAAGTYTFSACVVDTAGESSCAPTVFVVGAAPAPAPAPEPEIGTSITLTGTNCVGNNVVVTGTASGPVGAYVNSHYSDAPQCGSWTSTSDWGCRRAEGQPEATQWSYPFYKGQVSGDEQFVYIGGGTGASKRVYYEKNCP